MNARGEFWAATYNGKLNVESFELFLKDFIKNRGKEKIFLIMDGHPAHKAKTVQKYVASLVGQLEVHSLPAYSPDLNSDEFIWSYMKGSGVSKRPLKKNEALRTRVEEDLRKILPEPLHSPSRGQNYIRDRAALRSAESSPPAAPCPGCHQDRLGEWP